MIREDYVSFETAKLLKEKGFDECTICSFDKDGNPKDILRPFIESDGDVRKPTLQMAMKWLRELKRCIIVIIPKWFTPYGCAKYAYSIWADDNLEIDGETDKDTEYDTYEETCEEAIKYALKKLI